MRIVPFAALASALVAVVGVEGALSAKPDRPDPEEVTIVARPPSTPGSPTPQSAITCTLSIDNPHKSSHVQSTANVVSHWVCTSIVSRLTLNTKLWRSGIQVGSGTSSGNGTAWLNGNAAASCLNAQHQGTASGTVTFPPGYTPQYGSASVSSPVVSITNC